MWIDKNNVYISRCDYCISIKNNIINHISSISNSPLINDISQIISSYLPISKSVVRYTNIYNISLKMSQDHYFYKSNHSDDNEDDLCTLCKTRTPQPYKQIYFGYCFECFLELIHD